MTKILCGNPLCKYNRKKYCSRKDVNISSGSIVDKQGQRVDVWYCKDFVEDDGIDELRKIVKENMFKEIK